MAAVSASPAACTRGAQDDLCPIVEDGDLVITEIRGPQGGGDTYGQWIEILNTRPDAIDLRGVEIRMAKLDGSGEIRAFVRDAELMADPGAYTVVGLHNPFDLPAHVDTTIFADFSIETSTGAVEPRDLYADATLELFACDESVDRVVYRGLPQMGSYALDGAIEPTAKANDDELNWCNDIQEPPPDGPQTEIGLPGSPREANPPCP